MSLSLRPRSSRAVLPLLLIAVALVGYYGWITLDPAPGAPFSPLTTAVAGGVLLLGLLAYVVVRGTSRRRGGSGNDPAAVEGSPSVTDEPVQDVMDEPVHEVHGPVREEHPEPAAEHALDLDQLADLAVPERVTQLHIKTLEAALEEQSARIAELERESTGGHDLMRVLLTVGALRQRVQGSPESETLLNRVEAAVLRLNSSLEPARPALPAPVPGSRVAFVPAPTAPTATATPTHTATVAAAQDVEIEPAPVATPPIPEQPVGAQPVAPPAAQPAEEPVADEHVAPVPPPSRSVAPVDEPVLPVPPPPVQVAARGSRWRRRGVA